MLGNYLKYFTDPCIAEVSCYQSLSPLMGDEWKAKIFIANMAHRMTFCAADEESAKIAADTARRMPCARSSRAVFAGRDQ